MPSLRSATDAQIASLAAQGDQGAFGELYDRFGGQLFDFCARLTGSSQDGADITQEVFVRAATRLSQLREPERVRAWLFAVARHECYAFTQKRSKTVPNDPMKLGDTLEHRGRTATGLVESSELVALVHEARAGLDVDDAALLDLKFREDLSGQDLADAAGIPHDQLHKALARATERFEKAITAVVLARYGRKDCGELAKIVGDEADSLTPLLRKRVSRHVESCTECTTRKKKMINPATMSASAATKAAGMIPVPLDLRAMVISSVGSPSSSGASYGWQRNGFPRLRRKRRTLPVVAMIGALTVFGIAVGTDRATQPPIPAVTSPVTVVAVSTSLARTTLPPTTTSPPTTSSTSSTSTSTTVLSTTTRPPTTLAPTTLTTVPRVTVPVVAATVPPVVTTTRPPTPSRPTTSKPPKPTRPSSTVLVPTSTAVPTSLVTTTVETTSTAAVASTSPSTTLLIVVTSTTPLPTTTTVTPTTTTIPATTTTLAPVTTTTMAPTTTTKQGQNPTTTTTPLCITRACVLINPGVITINPGLFVTTTTQPVPIIK